MLQATEVLQKDLEGLFDDMFAHFMISAPKNKEVLQEDYNYFNKRFLSMMEYYKQELLKKEKLRTFIENSFSYIENDVEEILAKLNNIEEFMESIKEVRDIPEKELLIDEIPNNNIIEEVPKKIPRDFSNYFKSSKCPKRKRESSDEEEEIPKKKKKFNFESIVNYINTKNIEYAAAFINNYWYFWINGNMCLHKKLHTPIHNWKKNIPWKIIPGYDQDK